MRSRRALCVMNDAALRRIIEHTLSAAGVTVDHLDRIPDDTRELAVVVVDRATRQTAGDELCAVGAPVVIVGDDLDDDGLIAHMVDAPVSHLVGDPHDRDLQITWDKLASGDLFGIEKYLARGAAISERAVASDRDKRHAIAEVCAWAETVARWPIVHRIASVADELLMNALYDAGGGAAGERRAMLRWAADDRAIALSVADDCGTLRQRDVIDHVRRARNERGRPRPESQARGAGLGLYLVLANVASLVINVEAGQRTEVVCLFDRAPAERHAPSCARSLHVFQAPASAPLLSAG